MTKTNPVKIVITGGPCAGKTSVIDKLKIDFAHKITFVAESATILLSGGYPPPPNDSYKLQAWLAEFQSVVAALQLSLEARAVSETTELNHDAIVYDRSLGDLPAYHPKGFTAVMQQLRRLGINSIRDRYDVVLHLHSVAGFDIGLYGKEQNKHRYESKNEAIRINTRIYRSSQTVASEQISVLPQLNFDQKYQIVKNHIIAALAKRTQQ